MLTARGLFIDLDGTLYNGDYLIDGADRMIETFREHQIPFLFLTNNSSRTPEMVAEHLCRLGIEAKPDEVFQSAQAAAMYVMEGRTEPAKVFCIGEVGLLTALRQVGARIVEEDFPGVPDFVVQGIDRELTYDKLRRAVQYILSGATFVLTNPDLLLPWNRQFVPGAGSIGAMLEAATSVTPVVIGKPSPIIVRYALEHFNAVRGLSLTNNQIYLIGDNVRTDISAARNSGCQSVLVLTGLATADNVQQLIEDTGIVPNRVFRDLKECTDYLVSY